MLSVGFLLMPESKLLILKWGESFTVIRGAVNSCWGLKPIAAWFDTRSVCLVINLIGTNKEMWASLSASK